MLSTPLAEWPESILCRGFLRLDPLSSGPDRLETDGDAMFWLGYSSPVHCLEVALRQEPEQDLRELPDRWLRAAETLLQIRSQAPSRCRLFNIPRLSPEALRRLLTFRYAETTRPTAPIASRAAGLRRGSPARGRLSALERSQAAHSRRDPHPEAASPLVALVISRRPELLQLYADLEGQADLFGREPDVLPLLPPVEDQLLVATLLEQWQALARERWEQATEADQLRDRIAALDAQLTQSRRDQALTISRASQPESAADLRGARAAGLIAERPTGPGPTPDPDLASRLQEAEEERELLLLQLQQLEEELALSMVNKEQMRLQAAVPITVPVDQEQIGSLQAANEQLQAELHDLRQSNGQLRQRLHDLEDQSRYLFLHSQVQDNLDRGRISLILELVRQSLRR